MIRTVGGQGFAQRADGGWQRHGTQHQADEWRAMVYAPLDGTRVQLLIRHRTWWTAFKCDGAEGAKHWEAVCEGHWIDHNGGGWTWAGMAGEPQGWRPLPGMVQAAA